MSRRSDLDLLDDILGSLAKISQYISGLSYEDFLHDQKTQDAVVRNIEIIGEAAKLISKSIKENHPEVPWKQIAGTRDRLVHGYFGVNIDIVWEIAAMDAPKLLKAIRRIREELP